MAWSENHDPVQALLPHGPDESLGVGVGLRGAPRCAEDLDAFGFEHLVEHRAEAIVAVMHEVLHCNGSRLSGLGEIASDLDRKSTRLNSSHLGISYAVFCLKK